jgi:hypothetical protein
MHSSMAGLHSAPALSYAGALTNHLPSQASAQPSTQAGARPYVPLAASAQSLVLPTPFSQAATTPPRISIGASMFLFSIDPKYGVPLILLAREKKRRWVGNTNYNYTDFGGGATGGESAEQTAAREFVEESVGSVRYFSNPCRDKLPELAENIAADLSAGNYLARIETPVGPRKAYITFVKEVAFQPGICGAFRRAKELLFRAQSDVEAMSPRKRDAAIDHPALRHDRETGAVVINRCYLEKQGVEYFSLQGLTYWLTTGAHNLVPGFHCQPYFKGRLRVALRCLRDCVRDAHRVRSARCGKFLPFKTKPSYTHFPHQQQRLLHRLPSPAHQPFQSLHDGRADPAHDPANCGWEWADGNHAGGDSDHGRLRRWPRRHFGRVRHDQPSERVDDDALAQNRFGGRRGRHLGSSSNSSNSGDDDRDRHRRAAQRHGDADGRSRGRGLGRGRRQGGGRGRGGGGRGRGAGARVRPRPAVHNHRWR